MEGDLLGKCGKRKLSFGDDPPAKRQALHRTPTEELIDDLPESSLLRKTSSELEDGSLSKKNSLVLQRKISSILQPSSSFQTINLSRVDSAQDEIISVEPTNELKNLPAEIWIEIFLYLPDFSRWALAKTCRRFVSIFERWVGFSMMPVYFTDGLQSLVEHSAVIPLTESVTTPNFRFYKMEDMPQTHHVNDMFLLAGRKKISFYALRELKRHEFMIIACNRNVTMHESALLTSGRVAIIPLNVQSENYFFPAELLPCNKEFEKLFGFMNEEAADERFLLGTITAHPGGNCEFLLQIDSSGIKNAISSREELRVNEKQAILLMIQENAKRTFRLMNWHRAYKGIHCPKIPAPQPNGFTDIKLYEYQLKALAWMKNIEQHAYTKKYAFSTLYKAPGNMGFWVNVKPKGLEPKISLAEVTSWRQRQLYEKHGVGPWFVDERNWNYHLSEESDDPNNMDSFMTRGGIMADEMGLGKTISMIALILAHPRQANVEGKFVSKQRNPLAHFESKATLIICPSQLVNQWKLEIEKRTSLSVLVIATITNVKSCQYQALLDYDVVITAHNLIVNNKKYHAMCEGELTTPITLSSKKALFHHVGWHRMIIDEGHEVLSDVNNCGNAYASPNIWEQYDSNYCWYVTGTPLPRGAASFIGAMNFLHISLQSGADIGESNEQFAYDCLLAQAVHKCLFWRNTKETVKQQTKIPPLTESIQYLSLSPIEQALYDAAETNEEKRQIISSPFLSSLIPVHFAPPKGKEPTLNDIPPFLLQSYKKRVEQAKSSLGELKNQIKEWKVSLQKAKEDFDPVEDNPPPMPRYHMLGLCNTEAERLECKRYQDWMKKKRAKETAATTLNSKKVALNTAQENIVIWLTQMSCFLRLFPHKASDPCGLCENMIIGPVNTPCDHQFCAHCISMHVNQNENCPTCHISLVLETLDYSQVLGTFVNEKLKIIVNQNQKHSKWQNEITTYHGSKLATIATHLREMIEEKVKVIVFSQYENILSTLTGILEKALPKRKQGKYIVTCKGNIHIRKKILEQFNATDDDSPRVLMLSLSHSASGTHLAVATHIVLVDPVIGSKEEAQATDSQAIARAHRLGQDRPVLAVRFIVENTIDQDDYEQTYGITLENN